MKKVNFAILILLLIITVAIPYAYSIEPNCRNDCYETIPYQTREMLFAMPQCPQCTVRVVFLTRYGTCEGDPVRDIYIEQMTGLTADCCICGTFNDLSSLLEVTLQKILTLYRWDDLQVGAADCVTVKYPPCMRAISKRSRIFCLNDECCIHWYKFIVHSTANYITGHRVVQDYNGECPIYEGVQCENICSVHVETPYPDPPPPIMQGTDDENSADGIDLQVVPNPADEKVEIKLPKSIDLYSLEIYNFIGQLVHKQNLEGYAKNNYITVSKYPSGLYYLILRTLSGQVLKMHFIIKH